MAKQSPSLASPAIAEGGFFTAPWLRFFTDLVSPAKAFSATVLGASPATYTASDNGHATISGGTVSLVQIKRGAITYTMPGTSGIFPVSAGDALIVTYSALPTFHFLPW